VALTPRRGAVAAVQTDRLAPAWPRRSPCRGSTQIIARTAPRRNPRPRRGGRPHRQRAGALLPADPSRASSNPASTEGAGHRRSAPADAEFRCVVASRREYVACGWSRACRRRHRWRRLRG